MDIGVFFLHLIPLAVLIDTIFVMFGGRVFQQMAFLWVSTVFPFRRLVHLFVRGKLIQALFTKNEKDASPII
jgi:hypothetical protein